MFFHLWAISALCAVTLSAPFAPGSASRPEEMKVLSDYFHMLATKVQEGRNMAMAPICDISKATLPVASPTPLAGPAEGMTLKHVAIGRGIQNYTCSTTNATAAPKPIGAVATLYNASCVAATYPDLLNILPKLALEFSITPENQELGPSNLVVSGHHYFTNNTSPFFDLNTSGLELGVAPCQKNSSVPAPAGAVVGQNNQGLGAVAWLKLTTRSGATGGLQEVYRVNTAGGSPPKICEGMPATFEIQYSAEYWFFGSS
ncbi:hypothetical protein BJ875DRAFT_220747 [Amylocarpus encephaloides]|uniref:Malate dehydrogenase n=1 Tax=Amylocarpus encephaloides TaxID=45428 RepID=A0A9P7YT21_9HELO|nr:hypothetical protein BJ875DRAFT_220747 [Amylocarpus encephaloides]